MKKLRKFGLILSNLLIVQVLVTHLGAIATATQVKDLVHLHGSPPPVDLFDLVMDPSPDVRSKALERLKGFHPKRILLLGDKENPYNQWFSLADNLGEVFRDQEVEIYKTDILCQNKEYDSEKNFIEKRLDHTQDFPFADNYFDVIMGLRILCRCSTAKKGHYCGGLAVNQLASFLGEVARVLNKDNKNSFALVQGDVVLHFNEFDALADARDDVATRFPSMRFVQKIVRWVVPGPGSEPSATVKIFPRGIYMGNLDFWALSRRLEKGSGRGCSIL